jgi:hypothetical protein
MTLICNEREESGPGLNTRVVLRGALVWWALIITILPGNPVLAQEAVTAQPNPEERLEIAENEFRYQDYAKAADLLRPLLYPAVLLRKKADRIKAREYLAACSWWLNKKSDAREEFTALLLEKPTHQLDPFYYPGPLVSFLEALRQELKTKGIVGPQEDPKKTKPKKIRIQAADPPWMTNFIPFGVPQFMHRRKKTGWTILVGQLLSMGTTLVTAIWIEQLRGPDGFFSSENHGTAQNLNKVWWVGTAIFGGLYLYGVADGFLSKPALSVTPEIRP